MKLYHFNPNDWGEQYHVMAEDKIKAHEYLLAYFQKLITDPKEKTFKSLIKKDLKMWKKVNPLDITTFPTKYTLDEYNVGEILDSEIA
jgi:hypothetical protein